MTIDQLSHRLRERLKSEYGEGESRDMVRLIFHALKGWNTTQLIVHGDSEASEWLQQKSSEIVERIEKGEPVQYILGEAYFYGMDFKVTPDVLIPRPETAELVDMIVNQNRASDLRVLDIGTGSGAIAVALARNLMFPQITAMDISSEAIAVARENASRLHAGIRFVREDIFVYDPQPDSFDIIVSNPPYVTESEKMAMSRNVLDYEPSVALFVKDDTPLIYYSRIAEISRRALSPGGKIYFEINPLFADQLKSMLISCGFVDVSLSKDSYNRIRFASARKPSVR